MFSSGFKYIDLYFGKIITYSPNNEDAAVVMHINTKRTENKLGNCSSISPPARPIPQITKTTASDLVIKNVSL